MSTRRSFENGVSKNLSYSRFWAERAEAGLVTPALKVNDLAFTSLSDTV